ncbi:hypothetical protein [Noviherbaspirillum malthae]|uniref:hypothetical protein n=1 Tax=Noviherbaspirillum malthae TaxID=1260987 RepID=UPI00188F42CF|nr:hypothetical protein [Noviherbaspirillum malthae]
MKSTQQHNKASLHAPNDGRCSRKHAGVLPPKTLHNMREARDLLAELTGRRVLLIGDPDDLPCPEGAITRGPQVIELPIRRHADPQAAAEAAGHIINGLKALVAAEMPNILQGGSKTRLRLSVEGFADEQYLFANGEVRAWARTVFILYVPQAIALLDEVSYEFISTCCNRVKSVQEIGDLPGKPCYITVEPLPEWTIACYLSGIDANLKMPWWLDPSLSDDELAARLSSPAREVAGH